MAITFVGIERNWYEFGSNNQSWNALAARQAGDLLVVYDFHGATWGTSGIASSGKYTEVRPGSPWTPSGGSHHALWWRIATADANDNPGLVYNGSATGSLVQAGHHMLVFRGVNQIDPIIGYQTDYVTGVTTWKTSAVASVPAGQSPCVACHFLMIDRDRAGASLTRPALNDIADEDTWNDGGLANAGSASGAAGMCFGWEERVADGAIPQKQWTGGASVDIDAVCLLLRPDTASLAQPIIIGSTII